MTQSIDLEFDRTLVALAGFPFGQATFQNQVKEKANLKDSVIIKFPNNITRIASSFVQGFFDEWLNNYGADAIIKYVQIISSNEKIHELIFSNLN